MATNIGNLDMGLEVGFVGGMVAFFRGFRGYRASRLLQAAASKVSNDYWR